MEISPQPAILDVGIHARKRRFHGKVLRRVLQAFPSVATPGGKGQPEPLDEGLPASFLLLSRSGENDSRVEGRSYQTAQGTNQGHGSRGTQSRVSKRACGEDAGTAAVSR